MDIETKKHFEKHYQGSPWSQLVWVGEAIENFPAPPRAGMTSFRERENVFSLANFFKFIYWPVSWKERLFMSPAYCENFLGTSVP